ncbi:MAG: alpha/beta hydrolase fold protein [Pseudonocardiales bacterium]|nr:alpha/beta hydrolase fold protein [Pseudonocardiales bacterium]
MRRSPGSSGPIVVARLTDDALPGIDDRIPPWPGVRVVAGGAQLHVRRTPPANADAEPAFYVHGLAGSSTNWTDFAGALAPWLDGEAVDLPGFGRSGPPPGNDYSIPAFARILIAYLDDRGRGPVHLFGNSMGGAVCLHIAAGRPELVRSLTLISPAVPDLRLRRPGTDSAMGLFLIPGVRPLAERRLAAVSPEARARGLIEVCFADPRRVPQHRLDEAVEDVRDRQNLPWAMEAFTRSLRGLVKSYVGVGRWSPWRLMTRIQAPTLIVWGTEDKLVDVSLAPRVARSIPDSRLLVLPDTGHTAQLEDPLVTARAFLALRADIAAGATGRSSSEVPAARAPGTAGNRVGM